MNQNEFAVLTALDLHGEGLTGRELTTLTDPKVGLMSIYTVLAQLVSFGWVIEHEVTEDELPMTRHYLTNKGRRARRDQECAATESLPANAAAPTHGTATG